MIDVSMDKRVMPALKIPESQIRKLDITDTERIERFRTAGYGGNVSDALWALGICNTVLSQQFKALRQGMVLVGRALPVKLHTVVIDSSLGPGGESSSYVEDKLNGTEHPQKRMMRCVAESEPGSILCFDCGGDMQPAHFGEMSCQLAYSHGCRGMLIAGNCRDTQYVLKMPDFPMFSFGTAPNAFGGWIVTAPKSSPRKSLTRFCFGWRRFTRKKTSSARLWRMEWTSTEYIPSSVCCKDNYIGMT